MGTGIWGLHATHSQIKQNKSNLSERTSDVQ